MPDVGNAYLTVKPKVDGASFKNEMSTQMDAAGTAAGSKFGGSLSIAAGNLLSSFAEKAASALGDFISDSIQVGSGFQSAMSQVAATMGMSVSDITTEGTQAYETFQALSDKAKELGSTTTYSATQAAEGLNILAMSGYGADESMGMLEDVLHLAAAGSMDMAAAAGYVSGSMKGFADETKSAQYYADLMAQGATLANTSVSQLGEAMSGGSASAAAYGQTAESMTISLLRLAEQGEVGSAASTALAAAMKDLYTPSDQAAKALAELGVAAYENGQALDFNDVVNGLSQALSGMSAEEANAYKQTIFGIQGLQAFNKMTVTGTEKQMEWAEALASASEGVGAAAGQYEVMNANLAGSVAGFQSAMEGVQIAVFEIVEPALSAFVDAGTNLMSTIGDCLGSDGVTGAFSSMGDAVFSIVGSVMSFITGPACQAVQLVLRYVTPILNAIGALVESVMSAIGTVVDSVLKGVGTVVETVLPYVQGIFDAVFAQIGGETDETWNGIGDVVEMVADAISAVVSAVFPFVADVIGVAFHAISAVAGAVWPVVSGLVETAADAIGRAIEGLSPIVEFVTGVFGAVHDAIAGPIEAARDAIHNAIEAIKGFFSFQIQWPHIPVPHFSISGSFNPVDWLTQGTPSIGIEWYANGGFVNSPTLIGAGEAGTEMILPKNGGMMDEFADAVTGRSDEMLIKWLDRNLGPIISEYAPALTRREFERMARGSV